MGSGERKLTAYIFLVFVFGLIAWDVVVAVNDVPGDTISEIVLSWTGRFCVIPFAAGALMGHIFWTLKKKSSRWITIPMLFAVTACWLVWDIAVVCKISENICRNWLERHPIVPLLVGTVCGHFLWGQPQIEENKNGNTIHTNGTSGH